MVRRITDGCSIDCGGTPLRVYSRELGSQGGWTNYEDYMNSPTFVWYNHSTGGSSDYAWLPGHWMSDQEPPGEGSMFYQDAFGVQVVAGDFDTQQEPPHNRLPDYAMQDLLDNLWLYLPKIRIGQRIGYWPHPSEIFAPPPPPPAPPPIPPATPPPAPSSLVGGLPGTGIGQPGVPNDIIDFIVGIIVGETRYIIDDWIWNFQCKADNKGKVSRPHYCMACETACSAYCFDNRPPGVVDVTDCLIVCNKRKQKCLSTGSF